MKIYLTKVRHNSLLGVYCMLSSAAEVNNLSSTKKEKIFLINEHQEDIQRNIKPKRSKQMASR